MPHITTGRNVLHRLTAKEWPGRIFPAVHMSSEVIRSVTRSEADIAERGLWGDYQEAMSETLSHTSTEWAPWQVIPADRKWFARIATAAEILPATRP